jgi:hypothetical protein
VTGTRQKTKHLDKGAGADAGETRPQTSSEEFLALHPDRRIQRRAPAPYPVVLTQSEKDKRAILAALNHDIHDKCPVSIDWRAFHKRPEDFIHVQNDHYMANRAACLRASSYIAFHSAKVALAAMASCGWWFCGRNLKADRWANLWKAIEILRESGDDPNGWELAYRVHAYGQNVEWAREWPKWKGLWEFIAMNPDRPATTIDDDTLTQLRAIEWAKHPPKGVGKPVDAPYHRFLNGYPVKFWEELPEKPPEDSLSAKWTPAVAAASLVLFGLVKEGSTLKKETHRAQEAWYLGKELNVGRKSKVR